MIIILRKMNERQRMISGEKNVRRCMGFIYVCDELEGRQQWKNNSK